ncbi:hypothetical protein D0869_07106 [Hortaea werneckii]|uniref:F-box domain-containing protein n=1 Tax=Hortaea werneckii TaxID=91943 RepID=A0A3M6Y211_HORWE|nr:hypothetical protein KC324_g11379 [Hortaea werneckii]KAI7579471.1 hypothetical protein KC316_g9432 [Hortaea werneckii]RMX81047.1 hypothetical protein D0869_07106 [Hortaea werneckii]RMX96961.1 hypothetical protein D0868_10896 [Hortaea werneckii]
MDRLPEEVILHIITYLTFPENLVLQAVSSRFLTLARDDTIWKQETFTHSRAEALRRRQQLLDAQDARLAELRNAVTALPGSDLTAWDVSQLRGSPQPRAASDPHAEAKAQRQRAFANWEPAFPDERLDYYDEFIRRHAPISVGWLNLPKAQQNADREEVREATGIGTLNDADSGSVQNLVAPLDDGSICIWDVSRRSTVDYGGGGKLLGQSTPGLLTGQPPNATAESHNIMTETGAVECVSIDNEAKKGYFAVQSLLHEVDLNTLQLTSTKQYPFPITALSKCEPNVPLTVGTNWTIHLHDPRDPAFSATSGEDASGDRAELIGGSPYSHATLAQPGPLSILHEPGTSNNNTPNPNSIWVGGRFTSLLNYDRRFFPKLLGTIFSGARIASLSLLPFPLIPRNLDLLRNPSVAIHDRITAKKSPGATLVAAAEYKGKGSLEFYGLSSSHDDDDASAAVVAERQPHYQNRQTASASKLLAAVPQGGTVVFADGDGNLKWHERDGFSVVRTFNINETLPTNNNDRHQDAYSSDRGGAGAGAGGRPTEPSTGQGDIVQKILPTHPITATSTSTSTSPSPANQPTHQNAAREDLPTSNLLLWTGDGRIGVLGYGPYDPLRPPTTANEGRSARKFSRSSRAARAGRCRKAVWDGDAAGVGKECG